MPGNFFSYLKLPLDPPFMQGGSKGMFLNLYQIQRATGEEIDHACNQAGYADEL